MTTHFVSCTCGAFSLSLHRSQRRQEATPLIIPEFVPISMVFAVTVRAPARAREPFVPELDSSVVQPKQHKQSMGVKGGSAYYDKQRALRRASCCNDAVMLRSLTPPHTLWRPFMTKLIDSHTHSNKDN